MLSYLWLPPPRFVSVPSLACRVERRQKTKEGRTDTSIKIPTAFLALPSSTRTPQGRKVALGRPILLRTVAAQAVEP